MGSLILLDVNVLVAVYREDHVHHAPAYAFLERLHDQRGLFVLCDAALSGLLRVVSQARIFSVPSPVDEVFAFANELLRSPSCLRIAPGRDHWRLFENLCRESGAAGALITDAYLAALALEHGCALATFDKDFDRFPGLRIVRPA